MPRAVFETRFFIHLFSSPDPNVHKSLLELMRRYDRRYISTIILFEIYKISIEREGKAIAETRISRVKNEFEAVPVNEEVAVRGAQLKHTLKVQKDQDIPMADSLIAATSIINKTECITDSSHLLDIPRLRRRWIRQSKQP